MQASYEIKNSEPVNSLKRALSSNVFPFFTAAITLFSYYFGLDLLLFYYLTISGILILLLLDDLTPVISVFMFMSVSVSLVNTPTTSISTTDFYHDPDIYVQIFGLIVLFISTAVYRLIKTVVQKKFTLTPAFFGMCALAAALLINGIFSSNYTPKNLLYGLIMAACFLVIFSVLKDNITVNSECYEKISYSFLAFSILLVFTLLIAYATTEGLVTDDGINRSKLIFGWGVYNTFGTYLTMCIPAVIYLAGKKELGFVYTLYSFILFVAVFFSCSRQAMLGGAVIYPLCAVALLVKGRHKLANACILSAASIALILVLALYREAVFAFFDKLMANLIVDGKPNGSGRARIWLEALKNFTSSPVFGKGFYVSFSYTGHSGMEFIPLMCHNTPLQLLSACGITGFAAYLVHRIQTVTGLFKNPTTGRLTIAATVSVLLIISLVDNHIFNIFPTIIYSSLIAVLAAGERKEKMQML